MEESIYKRPFMYVIGIITYMSLVVSSLDAKDITLTVPQYGVYEYFYELISDSMKLIGHNVKLETLSPNLSGKRLLKLLRDGSLSLHWRGESKDKNAEFIYVDFKVTKGLKGNRVLWIPKGSQYIYNNVKNINDFRALNKVAALGANWSDVKIWKYNRLKYKEKDGKWNPHIYNMLAKGDRGFDYFPKAITAVANSLEKKKFPFLDIEKNLVFVYDRDFRIYLNQKDIWLKNEIERGIKLADKNGIVDKLLNKHFSNVYDKNKLNLQGRKIIKLLLEY